MTKVTAAQDLLEFHPFAGAFPLMNGDEFKELAADIKKNGLREPITLYQGKILDGRNRYRGCINAKVVEQFAQFEGDDAAARAFVFSKNIHRRHLSAAAKRDAIAALVKMSPEKSDRTLAKEAGTTHPTIAKARKQAEATGKALPVEKRTGADGKRRKQPTKKKRPPTEDDFRKQMATKRTATAAPVPAEPVTRDAAAPDDKLELLIEFARFTIDRADKFTFSLEDKAKWRALCAKVKTALGDVS